MARVRWSSSLALKTPGLTKSLLLDLRLLKQVWNFLLQDVVEILMLEE